VKSGADGVHESTQERVWAAEAAAPCSGKLLWSGAKAEIECGPQKGRGVGPGWRHAV